MSFFTDEYFMQQALIEAETALDKGEVPIGAVIVCRDRVIARAHNLTETLGDFTAHAEMQAFTSASNFLGSKYLDDCSLYVTLEPCGMCAGAAFWTRISKIVYGAADLKMGYTRYNPSMLHPKTKIVHGIKQNECAALLTNFFEKKRKR